MTTLLRYTTPLRCTTLFAMLALACNALAADPWADSVLDFNSGTGAAPGFDDPATTLGEPTRFTNTAFGSGDVTPFFGAGGNGEMVSIGEGGSLTVRFDEPVMNDPLNPYGIDLLVFGNAILFGADFPVTPTSTLTGLFGEGGVISVSSDGQTFVEVTGVAADGLYPTAAYRDFELGAASGLADFTLPVDPAYDPLGDTPVEIFAAYDGSGGGAGIDIGPLGFDSISFVRVTNPVGSGGTPEIDAFVDVRSIPEPTAVVLLALAVVPFAARVR